MTIKTIADARIPYLYLLSQLDHRQMRDECKAATPDRPFLAQTAKNVELATGRWTPLARINGIIVVSYKARRIGIIHVFDKPLVNRQLAAFVAGSYPLNSGDVTS